LRVGAGECGFEVTERPFEFSAFPGSFGAPVAGACAILALLLTCACCGAGRPAAAIVVLVVAGAVLTLGGWAIGGGGVLSLPVMRRRAVNLEGVRGSTIPRVWLVAHIDSKSQPVPMLLRAASVALLIVCGGAVLTLAIEQQAHLIGTRPWPWMAAASAIVGFPVLLSFVGARNTGALDNATGVATVLAAVKLLPPDASVGVLITDAEELALAGARAWCVGRPPAIALNCDTVDDRGGLTVMTFGGRGRSQTPDLIGVWRSAAQSIGEPLRVIPLIPGVLTDSVAFAASGWRTVTLSRGTIGTLRQIHTTRDDLNHVHGTGIDGAARLLARAAMDLARLG